MSARPETMPENDVVELLLHQHQEIRRLFTQVENSTGPERREAFDRLRRFLAVHETAEEMIVHPLARRTVPDGERVIEARLQEENQAKRMLQELERMDTGSDTFLPALIQFRDAVLAHADQEEREEFAQLQDAQGNRQRQVMGLAVKAAEAMAPTHPHPGMESAKANLLAGPYAAMMDRTRDVIRQTMQRISG
jgi:hemerythrin superfamily protein